MVEIKLNKPRKRRSKKSIKYLIISTGDVGKI